MFAFVIMIVEFTPTKRKALKAIVPMKKTTKNKHNMSCDFISMTILSTLHLQF